MAGRFMKIKRVVIPFMTLVVMTSQLAGCATMTSDEMLKSMNESPEGSIEYAIPDTGKQSLDASGVINVGDQRFVSDSDSDGDIGLIGNQNNQEKAELSGDELIEYFQLAYDSCGSFESTSQEEQINFELDILASFCDTDGEKLPADYADQYKSWRPVEIEQPSEDTTETKTTKDPGEVSPTTKAPTSVVQQPVGSGQESNNKHNAEDDDPILSQIVGGNSKAWNPYEGMTPEEKAAQIEADRAMTQKIVDGITGSFG